MIETFDQPQDDGDFGDGAGMMEDDEDYSAWDAPVVDATTAAL